MFSQLKAPRNLAVGADIGVAEYSSYVAIDTNPAMTTTEIVDKLIQLATLNKQVSPFQYV
jgi:hypothetical protein